MEIVCYELVCCQLEPLVPTQLADIEAVDLDQLGRLLDFETPL